MDSAAISTLSRLLDEALHLVPRQREAWLFALAPEHQPFAPQLRLMLSRYGSDDHAAFIADGPQLATTGMLDTCREAPERAEALVGPYRLIRELGHGGMGTVWLAERADGSLKRQVALKLPRLAWGAGLAERMARERDIAALLEHPNIARLYDAGVDALGRPYLAMEYIAGQPLDAWCKAHGLSVAEKLRLFLQVARAVAYAHGRLVVHRDLKPSNVLVTPDGQAHLLDFGIAKLLHEAGAEVDDEQLTAAQGRVLTPHFASPEQIQGETITVASDVYSLGVLLYELLTGSLPHAPERKGLAALEEAVLAGEPGLASGRVKDNKGLVRALRSEIDSILGKALKRKPVDRYATVNAMAEDIERHLQGERVLARPDSVAYRFRKILDRHRLGFAAAAITLLALLTGSGVALEQARRAEAAASQASAEAARAKSESLRAEAVKDFVVDVFRVNSPSLPSNNAARELPAELLLDRGANLIESKFKDQPDLQAELFGVVAELFQNLSNSDLASKYSDKQLEALARLHAPPEAVARALLLQARAREGIYRISDEAQSLKQAIEVAPPDTLIRLEALIRLVEFLSYTTRYDLVEDELSRADAVARKLVGSSRVDLQACKLEYSIVSPK